MTVVEYRPSAADGQWKQPDHLSDRPSFKSRLLGRFISTASAEQLSMEDVDAVYAEIAQEMHTLDQRMCSQKWEKGDYRRMRAKRAAWGAVHQALQARRSKRARAEKRRKHLVRPFADLFQDVAREFLPEATYSQILELARQRNADAMAELAAMDDSADPLD